MPAPIRVAPKHQSPGSKKKNNNYISLLFDNRGFPDQQDDWEAILPEVKTGALIRKRKHIVTPLTDIDPTFGIEFDESLHGNMLHSDLDVSHLTPSQQTTVSDLIKKYW